MKHWLLAFVFLASAAQAQPIVDMSLSPEETLREPDIIRSNGEEFMAPDAYKPALTNGPDYYSMQSAQKKFFIDEYCGESMQPMIQSSKLRALVECAESTKKKACTAFAQLPEEAKEPIDNAAQCAYLSSQAGAANDYELQCRDAYAQQLWLLKKYWDDSETAHTILFLPDMLVDGGSMCQNSAR